MQISQVHEHNHIHSWKKVKQNLYITVGSLTKLKILSFKTHLFSNGWKITLYYTLCDTNGQL